ncbi:Holliday junction branch migration protein RuvA [Marinicella gelatinilytica]|uniref:Holliday junction branch migration protein RuvA n=1 Tax=Marinicella gelatinilytica TaxID=2996017 RepID=UPI00226082BA|nr:Holliday junction branch migration protein RuvA [Marinicella gelatinilytica]MCX7545376.1 Holliday junction branch migration protein RuvA [Marinicella gelatinilytica]
MIGHIQGQLIHTEPPAHLIVDVRGIGYEIEVPTSVFFELPELRKDIHLIIHHLVREDASILYGFRSFSQRQLFRTLLKVNGIGAKSALAVLSTMSSAEFSRVINDQDISAITQVPGIGKKTAQRLMIEMKDKVNFSELSDVTKGAQPARLGVQGEAVSALQSLGFKPQDARQIVNKIYKENKDLAVEEIIRMSLKQQGGQ